MIQKSGTERGGEKERLGMQFHLHEIRAVLTWKLLPQSCEMG